MLLIRSASLRGFRALVAELGGDAERLMEMVGLPTSAMDSDEQLVPTASQNLLLRHAARELNCPDFGLRLASRGDLSILGPLGAAIRSCGTLGEAFACLNRFAGTFSPGATLHVEADPYGAADIVAVGTSTVLFGGHDPGIDAGLGFAHRMCLELVGDDYGLRSVEMPYASQIPPHVYQEFFDAAVNFHRPHPRLRITRHGLTKPFKTPGNPQMRGLLERVLEGLLPQQSSSAIAPRVRGVIESALGIGLLDVAVVARSLAMSSRTLQRRLTNEGTTFGRIRDDVRRDGAVEYLTTTDLAMSRVAELLGFSEQAALSRRTRQWFGATPSEIRRNGTAQDGRRSPSAREYPAE